MSPGCTLNALYQGSKFRTMPSTRYLSGLCGLLSNPHSPEQYRVDGIVRNFDPWYKAFNVQPGDKLYLPPEQRVHIWG